MEQEQNQDTKTSEKMNPFIDELKKFIGSESEVSYFKGDKLETVKGTIKAINFGMLQVIVMTDTEKILIKNIIDIKRKRKG